MGFLPVILMGVYRCNPNPKPKLNPAMGPTNRQKRREEKIRRREEEEKQKRRRKEEKRREDQTRQDKTRQEKTRKEKRREDKRGEEKRREGKGREEKRREEKRREEEKRSVEKKIICFICQDQRIKRIERRNVHLVSARRCANKPKKIMNPPERFIPNFQNAVNMNISERNHVENQTSRGVHWTVDLMYLHTFHKDLGIQIGYPDRNIF